MAFIGKNPKSNTNTLVPQSALPGNPTDGMIFNSDGTTLPAGLYEYKNSQWNPVSNGEINYIQNSDAETGLTDYSVVGTISLALETTNPLFGNQSFKISSAGADYSGDYIKVATKTIDAAMVNNIMSGSLWVENKDLNSDDIEIKIYDVDNAAYISVLNGSTVGASAAGAFNHKFSFQATDSVNYELHIEILTTTTNAFDFIFDKVVLAPQAPAVVGAVITDWESYTPTFSTSVGTPSNVLLEHRRVGSNLEIRGTFRTGSVTGANAITMSLPDGLSIASDAGRVLVGNIGRDIGAAINNISAIADTSTPTVLYFGQINNGTNSPFLAAVGNAIWGSSERQGIFGVFSVPIAGWSSNVVMSSTTSNREVFLSAELSANQSITSANATTVIFDSVLTDTINGMNTSTGEYTIPEDGTYDMSANTYLTGLTTTEIYRASIQVNGVNAAIMDKVPDSTFLGIAVQRKLVLSKDDIVKVQIKSSVDTSYSVITSDKGTFFSIQKTNTGTQTIASSPTTESTGASGINYIDQWDAEDGITDWTVTGTIPLSTETTDPLFDTASFKIASAGGTDYSGDIVQVTTETIDNAMKYNMISGSLWVRNADLTSGDFKINIYDIDNSAYVSLVSGADISASTIDSNHKFSFQATDSVNYRFEIEVVTTSVTAYEFIWDNVIITPQAPAVVGAPITDWKSYTPTFTGLGTPSNVDFLYRRVGSNLEIQGTMITGTATAVSAKFSVPSGLSQEILQYNPPLGQAVAQNSATSEIVYSTFQPDATNIGFASKNYVGVTGTQIGSTKLISATVSVPIAGWSSNVIMSSTTSNREVSFSGVISSGNLTTSTTTIPYVSQVDTTNSYAAGVFTVPEDGNYRITANLNLNGSATGQDSALAIQDDSSGTYALTAVAQKFGYYTNFLTTSTLKSYSKGDHIKVTGSTGPGTIAFFQQSWLTIEKINTGTQTIAQDIQITTWKSYTPTMYGFGTPTNLSTYWRKVGDSIELRLNFSSGVVDANNINIDLPNGLVIDSSVPLSIIGSATTSYTGSNLIHPLGNGGSSFISIGRGGAFNGLSYTPGNSIMNTGDSLSIIASVQIEGW